MNCRNRKGTAKNMNGSESYVVTRSNDARKINCSAHTKEKSTVTLENYPHLESPTEKASQPHRTLRPKWAIFDQRRVLGKAA